MNLLIPNNNLELQTDVTGQPSGCVRHGLGASHPRTVASIETNMSRLVACAEPRSLHTVMASSSDYSAVFLPGDARDFHWLERKPGETTSLCFLPEQFLCHGAPDGQR